MKMEKPATIFFSALLVVSVFGVAIGALSGNIDGDSGEISFAGGYGTLDEPYLIENVHQLQNMTQSLDAHYELANDIDASETSEWNDGDGFYPVGEDTTDPFTGSLDGNGYNIQNLHIDRPGESLVGLFGFASEDAYVTDVSLTDADVTGNEFVGGLIGAFEGTIVLNSSVSGDVSGDSIVGGLIGANSGTVERSYSMTSIHASGDAGGLIGGSIGTVESSYSTGDVVGGGATGGLIGSLEGVSVNNCYSTGDVSGADPVGGLIGATAAGSFVRNSYSTGEVTGGSMMEGALIGLNYESTVQDSFSLDSPVIGWSEQGSQQGRVTDADESEMKDYPLYTRISYPDYDDLNEPWDFVGDPNDDEGEEDIWDIDEEINEGYPYLYWDEPKGHLLTLLEPVGDGTVEVAGVEVIEWPYEEVYDQDTEVELTAIPEDGWYLDDWNGTEEVGETITITMSEDKYITVQFAELKDHILTINIEGEGSTVPYEGTHHYEDGEQVNITVYPEEHWFFEGWTGDHEGEEEEITVTMDDDKEITANFKEVEIREIYDWYGLDQVRYNLTHDYILINDLDQDTAGYDELVDITGGWDPIGEYHEDDDLEFNGTFDGDGYEIRDLIIDRDETNQVGLFGVMEDSGEIKNAILVDAQVNGGDQSNIGLLLGGNNGTVSNSSATGSVSGNANIGGLVGLNSGSVVNSVAAVEVNGNWNLGGLVGCNDDTVSNSYATGDVSGIGYIGGLVGANKILGTVLNSYSTGEVTGDHGVGGLMGENLGDEENSFWDTQTSGTDVSEGGTGKTTGEMMTQSTFTDEGWDFDDIWHMVENITYPLLQWQELPEKTLMELDLEACAESGGWNYVSFNMDLVDERLETILSEIEGDYDRLMYYDASTDQWLSYVPGRPDHYNNLHSWNHRMGIWIRVTENATQTVEGYVPIVTDITLYPGWNMVGYPSGSDQIATEILPEEVSSIGIFNESTEYNVEYFSDDEFDSILLISGNGYWIYNGAEEPVTWTVEY